MAMTHPEPYAVGMLSLAMAAVGCVIVVALTAVACRNAHRFLPSPRARTVFWVGLALTLPLPFAALFTGEALRDLAVIPSFGWDAYAGGLRIVTKHGLLSDGRYLPVFWQAACGAGTVVLLTFSMTPLTVWCLHFHLGRDPHAVQLTGVVRLDGRPLPRALVAFHVVVGREFSAYAVVETDEAGRYEVHDLPARSFRVTVAADEAAAVPPGYSNAARTPLEYTPDRLGPVTWDLELRSLSPGPAPNQPLQPTGPA
jgi:hypothetical protein